MLAMLMNILKTAKNLLRKILPQPEFEPGIFRLVGSNLTNYLLFTYACLTMRCFLLDVGHCDKYMPPRWSRIGKTLVPARSII